MSEGYTGGVYRRNMPKKGVEKIRFCLLFKDYKELSFSILPLIYPPENDNLVEESFSEQG